MRRFWWQSWRRRWHPQVRRVGREGIALQGRPQVHQLIDGERREVVAEAGVWPGAHPSQAFPVGPGPPACVASAEVIEERRVAVRPV